eukprot:TRINITY_DN3596_c0_g1_i4.p1 TRINITY_DN3596_c0_g1~~TRINITY_DN3596_c0_g1_i4.p1  ORF type:complete len:1093 (+),score=263.31 TRINITY_DN3596_c0_g1_i4:67-3345(+)
MAAAEPRSPPCAEPPRSQLVPTEGESFFQALSPLREDGGRTCLRPQRIREGKLVKLMYDRLQRDMHARTAKSQKVWRRKHDMTLANLLAHYYIHSKAGYAEILEEESQKESLKEEVIADLRDPQALLTATDKEKPYVEIEAVCGLRALAEAVGFASCQEQAMARVKRGKSYFADPRSRLALLREWAGQVGLFPDTATLHAWAKQWPTVFHAATKDGKRRPACKQCGRTRGELETGASSSFPGDCRLCNPKAGARMLRVTQKGQLDAAQNVLDMGKLQEIDEKDFGKEGLFEAKDDDGVWNPIVVREKDKAKHSWGSRKHIVLDYMVDVWDEDTGKMVDWGSIPLEEIRRVREEESESEESSEGSEQDLAVVKERCAANIKGLQCMLNSQHKTMAEQLSQVEDSTREAICMLEAEEKIGSFLVGMRVVAVRDVVVEGRTVAKKGDTGTVQRPQEQSGGRVPVAFDHKRKPTVQVAPRCLKPKREVDIETAAAEAAAKEAAAAAPAAVAAEQAPAPDPDVRLAEKKKAKEQPTPKKKEEQPTPKKKEEQPTPKKKEEQKAEPSAAESPQQVAKGKRKGEVKEKDKAAAASKEAPAASEKASAKKKEAPAAQEGVGGKKQEKVAAPEGPGRKRKEVPAAQEAATGKQVSTPAAQPHPKPASKDVPIPVADGWVQAQQKQQRVAQRKAEQDAPTTPAAPAPRQFAPSESSGASVSPRPARPGGSRHASGSQQGPAGTPSDRGRHHRDPAGSSSPLPTATRSAAAPLAQPQRLRPAEEPGEGRSTGSCSPPPAAAAVLAAGPVAQPQHLPPAEEPGVPRARYTRPLEDLILRCGGGTARRSPAELEREVRTLERVGRALDMLEEKWRRPFLHSMRGFKEFCERTATERERAAADHRAAAARLRDTMQRITSYGRVPPSCQCGQVVPLEPRAELSVTLQDGGELLFTARLSRELGVEHVAPGGRRSSREPRLAGRVKWDPTAEVLTVNGKTYHPELPEWYGSRGPLLAAMSGQCGVAEGFPEQWAACPMCDSGGLRRGAEDAQRSYRAEEQRKAAFGVPFPTAREIAVDRAVWRRRLTMLQPPRVPLQPADRCDPPAD